MAQRARILPRKPDCQTVYNLTCGNEVIRETGPLIWPLRLAHQIPNFLACVGGVGLLCGAIIVASWVI